MNKDVNSSKDFTAGNKFPTVYSIRAVLKYPYVAGQDPAISVSQASPDKTVMGGRIGTIP